MQLLAAILVYYVLTGIGWIMTGSSGIAPGFGLLLLVLLVFSVLFGKTG